MRARDRRPALRKIPPFNSAILRLHLPLGMVKENWMRIIETAFSCLSKRLWGEHEDEGELSKEVSVLNNGSP